MTLLNFVCKCRAARAAGSARRTARKSAAKKIRNNESTREKITAVQKCRWNTAFYCVARNAHTARAHVTELTCANFRTRIDAHGREFTG